ncbi:hypothetical protein PYCCODRAFT_1426557 [Trametes coccinea BRFM310]|uniref:DUF6534 domain-containing protein n=1 Tax=Trametes coccinea (strain BRFM310) TaxID=1353009 RepID=A0A1Y2IJ39_TRAC3|nr:hypothetical protein PYCCODRAFT_1426557 [Trametes coccinea BRFM310]
MAAAPPSNLTPLDLSDSYGPILVGGNLSWAAWGVSCLQLFLYYTNYEKDSLAMKLFVFAIWLISTIAEVMVLAFMWQILILGWAEVPVTHPLALHRNWVASIVFAAVQVFFLFRIYKRTIHNLANLLRDPDIALLSTRRIIAMEISLRACSAVIDIVIAGVMTYLLYTRRHSNLTASVNLAATTSKRMIHRLIVLTAVTGFWTAIVALIDLVLMGVYTHGLQFGYLEYPLCSLHVNALLANLNARHFVRKGDVIKFSTFHESEDSATAVRGSEISSNRNTAPKGVTHPCNDYHGGY